MKKALIAAVILSILAGATWLSSKGDPLYDETVQAVTQLLDEAQRFPVEPGYTTEYPFKWVESEDGKKYRDWLPAWRKLQGPIEERLRYAESTGRLSWDQITRLRDLLAMAELTVSGRISDHQNEILDHLEQAQKTALEWLATAEFDTALPYIDNSSLFAKGARDTLVEARFGRGRTWHSGVDAWLITTTREICYRRQRVERLYQEFEWAMWERFAKQKGLDERLASSYMKEICGGMVSPVMMDAVKDQFGTRFPEEKLAIVQDDSTPERMRQREIASLAIHPPLPQTFSPNYFVTAVMSTEQGTIAAVVFRVHDRVYERRTVRVGDPILWSGSSWKVEDIDSTRQTVRVEHEPSGSTHVITADN